MIEVVVVLFFFSSRRRHTRFDCDWSSDVCSSDLQMQRRWEEQLAGYVAASFRVIRLGNTASQTVQFISKVVTAGILYFGAKLVIDRSEERRVGEEGRSRGAPDHLKKKKKQ